MWNDKHIEVRIPCSKDNNLAAIYNSALSDCRSDWVLFLDHDVFLCNPHWYKICLEALAALKQDPMAACIGCVCGGERHRHTMASNGFPNANIEDHIEISRGEYFKYGNTLQRIHQHIPGFFMLLRTSVARQINFRQVKRGRINNIDVDFGNRLLEAGYHIYTMPGLYIYHRRGMKHLKKEFTIKK